MIIRINFKKKVINSIWYIQKSINHHWRENKRRIFRNFYKKNVIVQYGVDSTYTNRQYRTFKDAVLFLKNNEVKNDSVNEDIQYSGYAYLLHRFPKNYYVMSDQELTQWSDMGYFYLKGDKKTGYLKKIAKVN